jgi:phosphoglycolate phosphatase-like HAD superfamily hydrolase
MTMINWSKVFEQEPSAVRKALKDATMLAFIDIDHTLADSYWRDPMIGNATWDEYHAAGRGDKPIPETVALVNSLHDSGWSVIGLTGRPERFRQMTLKWLIDYNIMLDHVIMRANDDYRTTAEFKLAEAKAVMAAEQNFIAIVFDDRDDVCAAFKAERIVAIQIQTSGGRHEPKEEACDH